MLLGNCKTSPSCSPCCPYFPFPLLLLPLNAFHISCPPCSPSLSLHLFALCFLHSFFWHSGSWCLLSPYMKSFLLYYLLFPTSIQYQQYHKSLFASLFSGTLPVPCFSEHFLYTVHTLQSSSIIPPAIHSSSWNSSSFCFILWLILLAENGLVLIFWSKETISLSYLTSWIPFHHQLSLSFTFNSSFSSVLAALKCVPCFLLLTGSGITSFILSVRPPLLCLTNPISNVDNQLTPNSSWSTNYVQVKFHCITFPPCMEITNPQRYTWKSHPVEFGILWCFAFKPIIVMRFSLVCWTGLNPQSCFLWIAVFPIHFLIHLPMFVPCCKHQRSFRWQLLFWSFLLRAFHIILVIISFQCPRSLWPKS